MGAGAYDLSRTDLERSESILGLLVIAYRYGVTENSSNLQTATCKFCKKNFTRLYQKGQFRKVQVYCNATCRNAWSNNRRVTARTTCRTRGCSGIAPIGRIKCRDCECVQERKRRESAANATYEDFTHLDTACYLCGNAQGPFHKDHVVPLARFAEYADECEDGEFSSGLRLACASCNLRKNAKPPAAFVLQLWQERHRLQVKRDPTCKQFLH